jgi:hypothetical protein
MNINLMIGLGVGLFGAFLILFEANRTARNYYLNKTEDNKK